MARRHLKKTSTPKEENVLTFPEKLVRELINEAWNSNDVSIIHGDLQDPSEDLTIISAVVAYENAYIDYEGEDGEEVVVRDESGDVEILSDSDKNALVIEAQVTVEEKLAGGKTELVDIAFTLQVVYNKPKGGTTGIELSIFLFDYAKKFVYFIDKDNAIYMILEQIHDEGWDARDFGNIGKMYEINEGTEIGSFRFDTDGFSEDNQLSSRIKKFGDRMQSVLTKPLSSKDPNISGPAQMFLNMGVYNMIMLTDRLEELEETLK